jgi:Grx4 family monothiol glutaredoxin
VSLQPVAVQVPPAAAAAPPAVNETRLRNLVSSAPVILFMKGTPEEAKCGFSRKTVALLQENDIPFASFNILTDDAVRSGLKTLFDWPTFPQLYVNGSLIGGLDILNEMAEGGELKKELGVTEDTVFRVTENTLDKRLEQLVNMAPVMLFMKGVPESPQVNAWKWWL